MGFLCGSAGKESACNAGDLGSIPGLGGSPGEGKGYPRQYSGLENSMDSICIVSGVTESDMTEQLSLLFQIKVIQKSLLLWYYNYQTLKLYFYFLDFFSPYKERMGEPLVSRHGFLRINQ